MIDKYVYVIVALLPLTAAILLFEKNPYNALILRGILGAIAALVYAVLGAADVALTEALVGTMLAVTLYVIAVRSSLVMRLGILKNTPEEYTQEFILQLKKVIDKYYLRLELVEYSTSEALEQALTNQEVHAICDQAEESASGNKLSYLTKIRIHRLFEILSKEFKIPNNYLQYVSVSQLEEKH